MLLASMIKLSARIQPTISEVFTTSKAVHAVVKNHCQHLYLVPRLRLSRGRTEPTTPSSSFLNKTQHGARSRFIFLVRPIKKSTNTKWYTIKRLLYSARRHRFHDENICLQLNAFLVQPLVFEFTIMLFTQTATDYGTLQPSQSKTNQDSKIECFLFSSDSLPTN